MVFPSISCFNQYIYVNDPFGIYCDLRSKVGVPLLYVVASQLSPNHSFQCIFSTLIYVIFTL